MRFFFRSLAIGLVIVGLIFGALYVFFPGQVAGVAFQMERDRAGLKRYEMDVAGGAYPMHIAYLDGGKGPPLLLVHGIGADKDNWTRTARFLTPHFRVIAIDLPGFGESTRAEGATYHVADQVANLTAIVAALKLDHFDLGGNSMGGWIAASYAVAHPDTVASLWLIDPGGLSTAKPSEMARRIKAGERVPLFSSNPEQFRELEHFVFVHAPYIPGAIQQVIQQRQAHDYDSNLRIFGELVEDLKDHPLESQVEGLPTPTLIVWGAEDRVLDDSGADVLHRLLPNSQVSILPGIGHLPMFEAPQLTAENYLRFRERVAAPAAPAHAT